MTTALEEANYRYPAELPKNRLYATQLLRREAFEHGARWLAEQLRKEVYSVQVDTSDREYEEDVYHIKSPGFNALIRQILAACGDVDTVAAHEKVVVDRLQNERGSEST